MNWLKQPYLPIFGKKHDSGNMVHHKLPGEIILSNIYPSKREKNKHNYSNQDFPNATIILQDR